MKYFAWYMYAWMSVLSPSARRAWVEIDVYEVYGLTICVALRKEGVG